MYILWKDAHVSGEDSEVSPSLFFVNGVAGVAEGSTSVTGGMVTMTGGLKLTCRCSCMIVLLLNYFLRNQ